MQDSTTKLSNLVVPGTQNGGTKSTSTAAVAGSKPSHLPIDIELAQQHHQGGARSLTLKSLAPYFVYPEKEVADKIGICLTSLKQQCRLLGLQRWPFRKIKAKSIGSLRKAFPEVEWSLVVRAHRALEASEEDPGRMEEAQQLLDRLHRLAAADSNTGNHATHAVKNVNTSNLAAAPPFSHQQMQSNMMPSFSKLGSSAVLGAAGQLDILSNPATAHMLHTLHQPFAAPAGYAPPGFAIPSAYPAMGAGNLSWGQAPMGMPGIAMHPSLLPSMIPPTLYPRVQGVPTASTTYPQAQPAAWQQQWPHDPRGHVPSMQSIMQPVPVSTSSVPANSPWYLPYSRRSENSSSSSAKRERPPSGEELESVVEKSVPVRSAVTSGENGHPDLLPKQQFSARKLQKTAAHQSATAVSEQKGESPKDSRQPPNQSISSSLNKAGSEQDERSSSNSHTPQNNAKSRSPGSPSVKE